MRKDAAGLLAFAMLVASQGLAFADCQCFANGRRYHHGEIACLKLPNGDQLARCDMVLNNSSWKKIQDGCPEAGAAPLTPAETPTVPSAIRTGTGPLPVWQPSRTAG
ncbi:hypothetical protein AB4144_06070 [Rhizobiaceae sp. 2RAB30]